MEWQEKTKHFDISLAQKRSCRKLTFDDQVDRIGGGYTNLVLSNASEMGVRMK
jgi:hypothetical protein